MKYYHDSRDKPGNYFPMPKSIFRLGLSSGEILVYAYLMYCEDRKTFQCHPSFSTIGEAVGMSNNTVKKYVRGLELKGLISTEHTKIKTRDGRVHNGSLLYTLKPIEPIEERYFQKVLAEQASKNAVQNALAEINREIQSGSFSVSEALVQKLEALSLSLENHKGNQNRGGNRNLRLPP